MSSTQDPLGLLQRAPRLSSLMTHPEVASAVRAGDAARLHRVLGVVASKGEQEHQRVAAGEVLKNRRLFAVPVEKAPTMQTFNGIGTAAHFASDKNPSDGSYITTLCATVLFLPLYPLGQYVVTSQGNTYFFQGKVPLSVAARAWRHVMHACFLLLAASVGLGVWESAQANPVWLVNALHVPVVVDVGGQQVRLGKFGRAVEKLPVATHHVKVSLPGGAVLEEAELTVPRWTDAVVYNVLGAAPVYSEGIVYSTEGNPADNPQRFLGGQRVIVEDGIRYVFTEPPKTIKIKGGSETRWMMDVQSGGYMATVNWLLERKEQPRAVDLLEHILLAQPDERDPAAGKLLANLLGEEEALAFGHRWLEQSPDAWGSNTFLQEQLAFQGKSDESLAFFRQRMEARPQSPDAALFYARLLPVEKSLPLLGNLTATFPNHTRLARLHGWQLFLAGDHVRAAERLQQVRKAAPVEFAGMEATLARALLASGKSQEALDLVTGWLGNRTDISMMDAVLYAQVLLVSGISPPPHPAEHYLSAAIKGGGAGPDARAWLHVITAGELADADVALLKDPHALAAARITAAAWRSSGEAITLLADAPAEALGYLPSDTTMLLAAEALRLHKPELAESIMEEDGNLPLDAEDLEDYLESGDEKLLAAADPLYRCGIHLVRARMVKNPAQAAGLMKLASLEDILRGNVTAALKAWKKP